MFKPDTNQYDSKDSKAGLLPFKAQLSPKLRTSFKKHYQKNIGSYDARQTFASGSKIKFHRCTNLSYFCFIHVISAYSVFFFAQQVQSQRRQLSIAENCTKNEAGRKKLSSALR